ncbi:MAG: ribbon-helix-helix domain-containing protein [Candidatus Nanohaloarchaea archaeon]
MATVSVKVPDRLKEDAEAAAEALGYTGLSEFVRDAMRDQIEAKLEMRKEIAERVQQLREHPDDIETYTLDEAREQMEE